MCLHKNLLEFLSLKKCNNLRDMFKSDKIISSNKELVMSDNILNYFIDKYNLDVNMLENKIVIIKDNIKVNFYNFTKFFKNEKELEDFLDLKIKKSNLKTIYLY